jgi:hypothetical protein
MVSGAGPNVSPSQLRRVVDTLKDFQCENPKDRIYGVLGLIDWDKHRTIPTPDYNKDLLELAKEILGMILEGKPDERGTWFKESFLDIIRKFRLMLKMPPQHEIVRNAIHAEHGLADDSATRDRPVYPRFPDLRWRGIRLSKLTQDAHTTDEIATAKSTIYLSSKQPNDDSHSEIVNCNGNAIAWAPKITDENDWYLECDRHYVGEVQYDMSVSDWRKGVRYSFYVWKALIVRQDGEGNYHIVGPALPTKETWRYLVRFPAPQCFRILWNLEDALVLEGLCCKYQYKTKEDIAELGDWSNMRAWDFPGSTIVRGPFDPDETVRQLLAKDFDEFREPGWY